MTNLPFQIQHQPDDTTCGPTCLHAVYQYYGDEIELPEIVGQIEKVEGGGTIAPILANHALRRGYDVTIYSYNLNIFDPTWFDPRVPDMIDRLEARLAFKTEQKLQVALRTYVDFVKLGGKVEMADLSPSLLRRYLRRHTPILTGLSATYLYRQAREYGPNDDHDDIKGDPAGHFVVLTGIDTESGEVTMADPMFPNPTCDRQNCAISLARVVTAILLGVMTYDANLMVITPKSASRSRASSSTLRVGDP